MSKRIFTDPELSLLIHNIIPTYQMQMVQDKQTAAEANQPRIAEVFDKQWHDADELRMKLEDIDVLAGEIGSQEPGRTKALEEALSNLLECIVVSWTPPNDEGDKLYKVEGFIHEAVTDARKVLDES